MFNLRRREFITLLGVRGGNVAALGVRILCHGRRPNILRCKLPGCAAHLVISITYFAERALVIFPSRLRSSSTWPSISRVQKQSVSTCRRRC